MLCSQNIDCSNGACDLQTNLCGPCQDDAACNDDEQDSYVCVKGECEPVSCVRDDQCYGGDRCSVAQHECVECAQDDHCASGRCNEATNRCGGCGDDRDCSFSEPLCEPKQHQCVECLVDNDCEQGICDPTTHACHGCKSRQDCRYSNTGIGQACDLSTNERVQGVQDADCNAQLPYFGHCDPARKACVQCLSDLDCENAGFGAADFCDPNTQQCVEAPVK